MASVASRHLYLNGDAASAAATIARLAQWAAPWPDDAADGLTLASPDLAPSGDGYTVVVLAECEDGAAVRPLGPAMRAFVMPLAAGRCEVALFADPPAPAGYLDTITAALRKRYPDGARDQGAGAGDASAFMTAVRAAYAATVQELNGRRDPTQDEVSKAMGYDDTQAFIRKRRREGFAQWADLKPRLTTK
jgi:hypothetical protein